MVTLALIAISLIATIVAPFGASPLVLLAAAPVVASTSKPGKKDDKKAGNTTRKPTVASLMKAFIKARKAHSPNLKKLEAALNAHKSAKFALDSFDFLNGDIEELEKLDKAESVANAALTKVMKAANTTHKAFVKAEKAYKKARGIADAPATPAQNADSSLSSVVSAKGTPSFPAKLPVGDNMSMICAHIIAAQFGNGAQYGASKPNGKRYHASPKGHGSTVGFIRLWADPKRIVILFPRLGKGEKLTDSWAHKRGVAERIDTARNPQVFLPIGNRETLHKRLVQIGQEANAHFTGA